MYMYGHFDVSGIMKLQLVLSVFVMLGTFICVVNCPDADFAGVNYPYPDQR